MLAFLASNTGFTKAELDGLTAQEAKFWLGGLTELAKRLERK